MGRTGAAAEGTRGISHRVQLLKRQKCSKGKFKLAREPNSFPARIIFRRVCVWDNANSSGLFAQTELADDFAIPIGVVRLEIVKQATALADQHQQPAARSMVLRVGLEVLGQFADALAQNRYLHLRASGVGLVSAESRDNVSFLSRC